MCHRRPDRSWSHNGTLDENILTLAALCVFPCPVCCLTDGSRLAAPVCCVQHVRCDNKQQCLQCMDHHDLLNIQWGERDAELSAEQNIVTAPEYDNPCVLTWRDIGLQRVKWSIISTLYDCRENCTQVFTTRMWSVWSLRSGGGILA